MGIGFSERVGDAVEESRLRIVAEGFFVIRHRLVRIGDSNVGLPKRKI